MKKIFIFGGISYDSLVYVDEFLNQPKTVFPKGYYETVGSTGSGKAVNLAKLDFQCTLHGLIGNDGFKNSIISYFKRDHLHLIYDSVSKTERHINLMNQNGERISYFVVPSDSNPTINETKLEAAIMSSDIVVLNIIDYTRHYIPLIQKHHKFIFTDLHDYDGKNPYHADYIMASDILFLSSEHLPNYLEWMETQIDQGKKCVICTHGKDGATAMDALKKLYFEPIIDDFNVIDTNGAGDSFFSGFLYGYSKAKSIQDCLKYGAIVAGLCVSSKELVHEDLNVNRLESLYKKYYETREL